MKTTQKLFLEQISDIYDAEHRLVLALPKMIRVAESQDLKGLLTQHLTETEGHVAKIEQVFKSLGKPNKARNCGAIIGILEEWDSLAAEFKSSSSLDEAIISVAQKLEHYEIAAYLGLLGQAGNLGLQAVIPILEQILVEEKTADRNLTETARAGRKQAALDNPPKLNGNAQDHINGNALRGNPRQLETAQSPTRAGTANREAIAQKAYDLYLRAGCPQGCELQHWLQAEKELNPQAGDSTN